MVIHIITLRKTTTLYKETHTHTHTVRTVRTRVCFKEDSGENEDKRVNENVCMRIVVAMQGKMSGWVRGSNKTKVLSAIHAV